MISEMVLVVLLAGVAAYRVTRLIVVDSLFAGTRATVHEWLEARNRLWADKLIDLTSCTFCCGSWISLLVWAVLMRGLGLHPGVTVMIVGWWATAGVQSLLHTWEGAEAEGDAG